MEQLRKDGYEVIEQFYEPISWAQPAGLRRGYHPQRHQDQGAADRRRRRQPPEAHHPGRVGVDNIAVKYAEEHGIQVKNTPRASSNAVAELALALLFSCARNISIAGHTMRENKWEKKAYSKGFELSGKTMGVIGYGRIGQLVGARSSLGMNVLSVVHRNKPEGCECETMHFVTMDELLSQSDIVVLCAPSGDKPLVDAESLAKMKDGVVIINVSRGANVNEAALLDALNSGKVKAAGLDVWLSEKDPNCPGSHPAVSCTPHIGAGTKEAQKRIGAELVDIVENFG